MSDIAIHLIMATLIWLIMALITLLSASLCGSIFGIFHITTGILAFATFVYGLAICRECAR